MTNPANTAGPVGDGSNSLAKESKVASMVQLVVTMALTGLFAWLAGLDTSHWGGFLGAVATGIVGALTGLAAAYKQANR